MITTNLLKIFDMHLFPNCSRLSPYFYYPRYIFTIHILLFKFFYLNSRQRYVLGDDAMQNLSKADIFIAGMGGVGVEIGENAIQI